MPEVHGKGLGGTNIRDTYKKEVEEGQAASEAATKVAQKMVSEKINRESKAKQQIYGETCLLYTSPSPRDGLLSRMPSSA